MENDDNRQIPPNLPTSDRNRTFYTALAIAAVAAAGFTLRSMTEDAPNTATQTNIERTHQTSSLRLSRRCFSRARPIARPIGGVFIFEEPKLRRVVQ
jgi:hypothetical protein